MPLPLLGLLALGGAAFASPYASNRNAQIRGDYLQRRADEAGIDLETATPDMLGAFGAQSGLIGLPDLLGDRRTGFEGVENRDAAMARQQVSIGAANMRHQMTLAQNQRQFEMEQEAKYTTMTPYQRAQLDVQGYNAETQRMTAQSRMDQIQAEMAADENARAREMLETQNQFIEIVQPIANQQQLTEFAIDKLDDASFDRAFWSSTEGNRLTQTINQQIFKQRQDFIKENYGENEPPPSVQEEVARMFPLIEADSLFQREGQQRDLVRQNLLRLRQTLANRRQMLEGSLQRSGVLVPQVAAQNVLPQGWEITQ